MPILEFPPISEADETGLLAVGGDLEVDSLLLAYSKGIFPWPISDQYPIVWYCPNPRGILFFKDFHISRSLQKSLKKQNFTVTINQSFKQVVQGCRLSMNRNGQKGTWITTQIEQSYIRLFEAGYAFSVEVWEESNLIGGMYGVCLGSYVCGESMFYIKTNASKVGLISLVQGLQRLGVQWMDTQMVTPLLHSFGATQISRDEYLKMHEKAVHSKWILPELVKLSPLKSQSRDE